MSTINCGGLYTRIVLQNTINKILREKTNNKFPRSVGNQYLVRNHSFVKLTGSTYYLHFDSATQSVIQAEITTPTGILRNDPICNEMTYLTSYWTTLAAGNGGGNLVVEPSRILPSGPVLPIVIALGQSNQAPRKLIADYSSTLQSAQTNTLGCWSTCDGSYSSNSLGWDQVQPFIMSDNVSIMGGTTLGLVNSLKATYPTVGMINYSFGGTSMNSNWKVGGNMTIGAKAFIQRSLNECPIPYKILGVVFNQGEADASSQGAADGWRALAAAMIDDFRSLPELTNCPFVIQRLDPTLTITYVPNVIASQNGVATDRARVAVSDGTSLLTGSSDGVHYSATQAELAGSRQAAALVSLQ
jgi:hypothetical protein